MRENHILKAQISCAVLVFVSLAVSIFSQTAAQPSKSPKEIVEEYWTFETTGGRLTAEGWKKSERYFVNAIPPPADKTIVVIDRDYAVWDPIIKGNRASVTVGLTIVGEISPEMGFRKHVHKSAKEGTIFDLVRSEVAGRSEWKIDGTHRKIWLTKEAARDYVSRMRDQSQDDAIKKRAQETLARLKNAA